MKNLFRFLMLLWLIGSLASCKPQAFLIETKKAQQIQSVVPDSTFLIDPNYEYRIRKDDKLSISIWNNDEISVGSVFGIYNSSEGYGKWLMVDKKGEISMPQIGKIKVVGLTLVQCKEILTQQMSKTIVHPIIDIKVLNKEITILGEVKNPGKYLLEKEKYSLTEVIGMAGYFDTYANKRRIKIIRSVDNKPKAITIDFGKMKDYAVSNIDIHPGDVVYIPSKKGKDWDKRAGSTILPISSAVTTILLLLKLFI